MKKEKCYRYIGYNGTITSSVLLEGINHQVCYKLTASAGKYLTDGEHNSYSVTVPEDEVELWREVNRV